MFEITPQDLVENLKGISLTFRTGILLIPAGYLNHEKDIAVSLGLDFIDIHKVAISSIGESQKFIGINREIIINYIDMGLDGNNGFTNCSYVANVDILVSYLSSEERKLFWKFMINNFRRNKGLIIGIPEGTNNIFTNRDLGEWNNVTRITRWENTEDDT